MNYPEAIAWLYSAQLHGIKLGLENTRRLLRALGLGSSLPGCRVLHVAGTNGKGSVCAMAESILRAAGRKTGLFTSPHLVCFRERVRVRGDMIPESAAAAILSEIRRATAGWEPSPTFFEIALGLALRHFADQGCDRIVLETGMGGRLDATSAIDADVAAITPVGLDHVRWLGGDLASIAGEKAGIIKPGRPVFSALQAPEAAAVIERVAREREAPLRWVDPAEAPACPLALAGPHQRGNAALAVAAALAVDPDLTGEAVAAGLASVQWPARFQRAGERVIIDGAHNVPAAAALAETWREEMGRGQKTAILFGSVEDKDSAGVMRCLAPLASRWIFAPLASPRGMAAERLEQIWRGLGIPGIPSSPAASVRAGLEDALSGRDPVLVAGSLYLAGEVLAILRGEPAPLPCAQ